jgi:hypothetical protein
VKSVRPSGRAESYPTEHLLTPGVPSPKANDGMGSHTSVTTRVSAATARRIARSLSDIDRQIIDTLATVTVATGRQLRRLHWPDSDTGRRLARRHLATLCRQRVIARLDRRVGGLRPGSDSYTHRLDVVGQRLVDESSLRRFRRPWTPGHAYLAHAVAVTECFVVLSELHRQGTLELLAFEAEPACWRPVPSDGRPQFLKPDAFAVTGQGEWELRHFIEVDRATEHPLRITRKARAYVDYWQSGTEQREHGVFPKVLWVAPDPNRAAVIVEAVSRLDPDTWRLFQVCAMAHLEGAVTLETADAVPETSP